MAEEKKKSKSLTKMPSKNEFMDAAKITKKAYDAFYEVGFTKDQAFELTKAMLKSPAMAPPRMSLI